VRFITDRLRSDCRRRAPAKLLAWVLRERRDGEGQQDGRGQGDQAFHLQARLRV
jgi:hypothetical protein